MKINMGDLGHLTHYLDTVGKLADLERTTKELDAELAESVVVMNKVKAMFGSLCSPPIVSDFEPQTMLEFLNARAPNMLLPNMAETDADIDLDDIISTMKGYAEDLQKNIMNKKAGQSSASQDITSLDVEQYANSLSQLGKRLANIRLAEDNGGADRSAELEQKMTKLCDDVGLFDQIVQSKSTLSEYNKNFPEAPQESAALCYGTLLNKLLSGLNEVNYLLQNKN